ncbi:Tm-1-like ATP-binding domain-containing protein [Faecalicatena contorta]|uniref:Tm-1-like ATP-binding domain-containing protein n=1 Tax=Faecalicatena contorta TaxID=39482 RepID=UPI0031D31393
MGNDHDITSPGLFQGILCIGGGQNTRMTAEAMKELPLGVPKMIVSPRFGKCKE